MLRSCLKAAAYGGGEEGVLVAVTSSGERRRQCQAIIGAQNHNFKGTPWLSSDESQAFVFKIKLFIYKIAMKIGLMSPEPVYYIGEQMLPPPLTADEENYLREVYSRKTVRRVLIERNLPCRLYCKEV